MPPVTVPGANAKDHNNVAVDPYECAESSLVGKHQKADQGVNNDTFCIDIVKLLNEKKLSYPQGYFVNDEKPCMKL